MDGQRKKNSLLISLENTNDGSGNYAITFAKGRVTVQFDGLLAAQAAKQKLEGEILPAWKRGTEAYLPTSGTYQGNRAEAAESAAALTQSGNARVLFYNLMGHGSDATPNAATALRRDLQLAMLADYSADILCFQEFHPGSYQNGFSAGLEAMGYAIVTVNTSGKNNYTPIYYRADRYEVKDSGYRLYTGENDSSSKGLTWALLQDKTGGKQIAVMSTHFWWKGYDAADKADFATHNATRLQNATELMETVASIQKAYGSDLPIVFGGDLNSLYDSDPVAKILETSGVSRAWDAAKVKNNNGGHHVVGTYQTASVTYTDGVKTGAQYNSGFSIDHIFVSGQVTVARFHTLLDRYALILSDHCPEIVDLTY